MMLLAARAIDEVEKDNAQLKAELNALSASLAVVENQQTALNNRVTILEETV